MAKLPQAIASSEQAKLWRAHGRRELAERLHHLLRELEGTPARKQLPSALAISQVSLYCVLKGQCTYGLFLQQIAKAELDRQQRMRTRAPAPQDSVLTPAQWSRLDLQGLIAKYAPHLSLSEAGGGGSLIPPEVVEPRVPDAVPFRNEVFEVAQDLAEELTPLLLLLATRVHQGLLAKGAVSSADGEGTRTMNRTAEIQALQHAIADLPFPAGILENSTSSTVLGCNSRLCDLLQVPPEALVQRSLGNLIGIATARIPKPMQTEFHGLLSRRMGARVARSQEKSPLCFQFYLNVCDSRYLSDGCYRITALASPAMTFGSFGDDLAVFLYHLKPSGPVRESGKN